MSDPRRADDEEILTGEASRVYGCSPQWIDALIKAGHLQARLISGRWRVVKRKDVEALARARERKRRAVAGHVE
jgi:hypothetical protein